LIEIARQPQTAPDCLAIRTGEGKIADYRLQIKVFAKRQDESIHQSMELLKRNGHGSIRKHSPPSNNFNASFQVLQRLIQLWKQCAMAQALKVFQASTIQLIIVCRLLDCIAVKKNRSSFVAKEREGIYSNH
jgi:hypothetical protein